MPEKDSYGVAPSEASERDYDFIFQTGELISVAVISHLIKINGLNTIGLSGGKAGIL